MIEVTRTGVKKMASTYLGVCSRCKCEFKAQSTDFDWTTRHPSIECPECGEFKSLFDCCRLTM